MGGGGGDIHDGIYEGDWVDGNRHGGGKLTYNNGDVYVGDFKFHMRDGIGKFTTFVIPDDGIGAPMPQAYDGQWIKDTMKGSGTMKYPNLDEYLGTWDEGKRVAGYGEMHYGLGGVYTGQFDSIKQKCGLGSFVYHDGRRYNGAFDGDACNGDGTMTYTDGSVYSGGFVRNQRCGKGTMEYANGDKYTGEWKDGERTNMTEGTMKYACGNEYIGQFQDGLRQSQAGVSCSMVYLDTSCYNGQWFQGMRHTGSDDNGSAQYGQMTYKNGDIYDGEWENDKFSRKGKMSYFNGDSYTGFWGQGLREGEGSMTYVMPEGSKGESGGASNVFTGTFRNGERKDGDGLMTYGDGSKYTGQWITEQRSGRGYYVDTVANNRNVYVGEWENDMKHGFGELQYVKEEMKFTGEFQFDMRFFKGLTTFDPGTPEAESYDGEYDTSERAFGFGKYTKKNGDVFEGYFEGGIQKTGSGTMVYAAPTTEGFVKYTGEWTGAGSDRAPFMAFSGKGQATYSDGAVYTGDWLKSIRAGKGVCSYANGDFYDGAWSGDKLSGRGEMVYNNGQDGKYEGEWKDGIRCGRGVMTYPDGATYTGNWSNDKRQDGAGVFVYGNPNHLENPERGTDVGGTYQGQWVFNTRNGKDERQGKGCMCYKNGDTYVGSWTEDERAGAGSMVYKIMRRTDPYTQFDRYNGQWKCDLYHGKGTLMQNNTNVYAGEFASGKRHGTGEQSYLIGDKFKGLWEMDKRPAQSDGYMYYANGDMYEGAWNGAEQRDGDGKMFYLNGSSYMGKWVKGLREGRGDWISANVNGDKYEGMWSKDKMCDKKTANNEGSRMSYASGDVYVGGWTNNQREGDGVFTFTPRVGNAKFPFSAAKGGLRAAARQAQPDCGKFEGQWHLNERCNGYGVMLYKDNSTYEGEFMDEQRSGQGTFVFGDKSKYAGTKYTGTFTADCIHGQGKMVFADRSSVYGNEKNGDVFTGAFFWGNRGQRGEMKYATGDCYDGQWNNGLRHGHGTHTFVKGLPVRDGRAGGNCPDAARGVFTGEWSYDSRIDGYGTMKYGDGLSGDAYEGLWTSDRDADGAECLGDDGYPVMLKNGVGTMTFADGSKYDGNFINDIFRGPGYAKGRKPM